MKTLLKTVTATVAGVLAASMVQANSVNALLGSGDQILLQSSDMAVSGGWDYFYTLRNNTDGGTVGIDAFTVSGLSDTNGIVVGATAGWGSSLNGPPFSNVSWSTGGPIVDLGSALTFYFFSPDFRSVRRPQHPHVR
jgi:hypothetical protein